MVSVIVITRNRPEVLPRCLEHLSRQTRPAQEIVVVDDFSSPSARRRNREACGERARYLELPRRHGMPRARNAGIREARGEVLAFLDDDCLAEPSWLESLLATYSQDVAGVGGLVRDPRWVYEPARGIGQIDALGRITSNFFGDPGGPCDVDLLPGGNMSFRKDWLERVGAFDAGFVATFHREDPDLCLRMRRAGGRLVYQPAARVDHLNARSLLRELRPHHELWLQFSYHRNEAYFLVKNFPGRWGVWRRLLLDDLVAMAGRVRSPVELASLPVAALSRLAGIAAGLAFHLRRGWR